MAVYPFQGLRPRPNWLEGKLFRRGGTAPRLLMARKEERGGGSSCLPHNNNNRACCGAQQQQYHKEENPGTCPGKSTFRALDPERALGGRKGTSQ